MARRDLARAATSHRLTSPLCLHPPVSVWNLEKGTAVFSMSSRHIIDVKFAIGFLLVMCRRSREDSVDVAIVDVKSAQVRCVGSTELHCAVPYALYIRAVLACRSSRSWL